MYRLTEAERQRKQERLAEIDKTVAMNRNDLVFELRLAELRYSQRAEELMRTFSKLPSSVETFDGSYQIGEVRKTLERIDPRDYLDKLRYLCRLADRMWFAAEMLDMHDNPDKWKEWVEDDYYQPDQENFTSWG
jgi:hypothetical protein